MIQLGLPRCLSEKHAGSPLWMGGGNLLCMESVQRQSLFLSNLFQVKWIPMSRLVETPLWERSFPKSHFEKWLWSPSLWHPLRQSDIGGSPLELGHRQTSVKNASTSVLLFLLAYPGTQMIVAACSQSSWTILVVLREGCSCIMRTKRVNSDSATYFLGDHIGLVISPLWSSLSSFEK